MINRDDWLAAVQEANNQPLPESDALTARELGELLGMAETTARRRLRAMVAIGMATPTTKLVRRGNAITKCPAYQLKTTPKKPLRKSK